MSEGTEGDPATRTVLVDASAHITLASVGRADLVPTLRGNCVVPEGVANEICQPPAADGLDRARSDGDLEVLPAPDSSRTAAAEHLGQEAATAATDPPGDVALLACALDATDPVVVTDDRPLRKTCRALSIPVSGSIGVLVRAVETEAIEADRARSTLYAMDEVGARLSASLVRRAEDLIEAASPD